jgi:O-antigen/teichoic acid export membrane protein
VKKHLTNAAYGVLDYASFPFGMLLVAPIVLHRLGASEYGLWMVSTAVVSAGGIIASGFTDANIQRVARLRGAGQVAAMVHAVRSMLGINLVLGSVLAILTWAASPFAARHIAASHLVPLGECLISLRIASVLILVRAVESVSVSTQRAFEQYSSTVRIAAGFRLLTLAAAAVLALAGHRTVSILVATGICLVLATVLQYRQVRLLLDGASLWPAFEPEATRALLKFGAFVWVQALGGVIFAQFDRILLGIYLGAGAVAPYSLCVQFSQPIAGLSGSGLNFLFPYLARSSETMSKEVLRRTVLKAFACNLAAVGICAGMLLLAGDRLMRLWAGAAVAQSAVKILPLVVLGSALIGISVTGFYALQALGLFRTVAIINLGSRAAMLPIMILLLRETGLHGLAVSRACLGAVALLVYVPLWRYLSAAGSEPRAATTAALPLALQEGSKS